MPRPVFPDFCLDVQDLSCTRGYRHLWGPLRFGLSCGQALHLRGKNGVGKTSLLRILAGFLRPSGGKIVMRLGEQHSEAKSLRRALVDFVGAHPPEDKRLTVREDLAYRAALMGRSRCEDAEEMISGLLPEAFAEVPVRHLSAGQQQRLNFARLRAGGRPLWLLDEPASSLDCFARRIASQWIADHLGCGGAAIIAGPDSLGLQLPEGAQTLDLDPTT